MSESKRLTALTLSALVTHAAKRFLQLRPLHGCGSFRLTGKSKRRAIFVPVHAIKQATNILDGMTRNVQNASGNEMQNVAEHREEINEKKKEFRRLHPGYASDDAKYYRKKRKLLAGERSAEEILGETH